MRARGRSGDDLVEVEPSALWLVIERQVDASGIRRGQLLEFVEKRRVFPGPARVVHLPGGAERDESLKYGPDRRHPDPARDQHGMRRALDKGEVVARRGDVDLGADAQLVVQIDRRAAARRGLLHAHHIAVRLVL